MTDLDAGIRASLEQWAPYRGADWDDVIARAGGRRSRRPLIVAVVVAGALVVGAAALAQSLGHGFGDWLRGSPGTSAPAADKAALERKTFAPLDPDLDVRQLLTTTYGGRTYRLIGFRSGGAVCLKVVTGTWAPGIACAAGDQLRRSHDLAVPLAVDAPLAAVRPGLPTAPRATYGLAAAQTRRVVLAGDGGSRDAKVANGAFLSVGPGPVTGHPTLRGFAVDRTGRRRAIPLAPALTKEIGQFRTGLPLLGPRRVEQPTSGGRIGWLGRREPRGEPVPKDLAALLYHPRSAALPGRIPSWPTLNIAGGDFARLIQPDPRDFLRVVVGRTKAGALCYDLVTRGGVGGSCLRRGTAFRTQPFNEGVTYSGSGPQFVLLDGIASEAVARLELVLGTGAVQHVALRDNAFVARVQRARLPARLVAYDAAGRVIGLSTLPPE